MKLSLFFIGLLVTVVTIGMSLYVFLASDSLGATSYVLYATVDNANGLLVDTEIKVAGIKVGRIRKMELVKQKALLTLELQKDFVVNSNDILKRIPQGILGASFLEIELTGKGKVLSNGDTFANIEDKSLIDQLSTEAGGIATNVSDITGNINDYLQTSDIYTRIDSIISALDTTVNNMSVITDSLAVNSQTSSQNIQFLIASMANITTALEKFIVNDKSTESQELSHTLQAIKESLRNIEQITRSINEGDGTIGKLINDDELYAEATEAIKNVNAITTRAAGLYTNFDYRYEGLISSSDFSYVSRNNINLRIAPAESSRYYQIGATFGGPERFDGAPSYSSTIGNSALKLNILLAQNFTSWLRLYGGLIENTGGAGIIITPIEQVELGAEAFDFGGGNTGALIRANAYVYPFFDPNDKANLLKWIYLGGGIDDILNSYGMNYYFGVGIRIHDEFLYDAVRLLPLASSVSTITQ